MRKVNLTILIVFCMLSAVLSPTPTAQAYEDIAHRFIVGKAGELYGQFGSSNEPNVFLQVIAGGAYNEDDWVHDHVFCYTDPYHTLPHFWDFDGDDGFHGLLWDDLVCYGGPVCVDYPNAWMKASGYRVGQFGCGGIRGLWQMALDEYTLNLWEAYERLGHVSHLIQDMSVPAHAHEDFHPTEDTYEETISNNIQVVLNQLDSREYDLGPVPIPCSNDWYGVWGDFFPLYYLMYTTNQRADFFASQDDWGDIIDLHGWINYQEWPDQLLYYVNPDHVKTLLCMCPKCRSLGCIGCYICDECKDCNEIKYPCHPQWVIAENYTLVYAVRATATLWHLFSIKANCCIKNINKPSPLNCYTTIQSAIQAAEPNEVIEVAAGTYYESIDFLGKAITLRSKDGPGVTTINANGLSHVVQCVKGEGPNTVLEGFTITGGNANGPDYADRDGGGMYNVNSSPKVTNCIFRDNKADHGGGMCDFNSSPTVTKCVFTDNSATNGGGMYNYYSSPTVTNCTFRINTASNNGGGMCNSPETSGPTLLNCMFTDNTASQYGGGIYNRACYNFSTLTNCTFIGNKADCGGAIYNNRYSSPSLTNCTFSSNIAYEDGSGMYNNDNSSPTVTNCILWGNKPDEIYDGAGCSTTATYNDVHGGYGGTGNIDADPCFVDPNGGDLRLQPDSPCIDIGDNNTPNLTDSDMDGHPRIIDGDCNGSAVVDMGAYEFALSYIGDFDNDCSVNFFDFSILARAWETEEGEPDWNGACDISEPADNYINLRDVAVLCNNWLAGTEPEL